MHDTIFASAPYKTGCDRKVIGLYRYMIVWRGATLSMTEIYSRRLRRGVLSKIRQKQAESTYRYAVTLFDRIDDLEREIKKKRDDIKACNKVLLSLLYREGIDMNTATEE